jgi:D-beta-D-heptose 7-phosphate kinase/D-beta-D-heptose 1-phosphate adenosyltransferase
MRKILDLKRARALVRGFAKARVLVVGDLIVDHFIWGNVGRISPEAPVPVVETTKETVLLGGAANVVANLRSLGGNATVSGVVGRDNDGRSLVKMLKNLSVKADGVEIERKRPTTIKTRVIAHNQQVVRFDRESREPLGNKVREKIFDFIRRAIKRCDAVVISDYAKGLITEELVAFVTSEAQRADVPVLVDPKVDNMDFYKGADVITPNNSEASCAAGFEITDKTSLKKAGSLFLKRHELRAVLITRGEQGMSLFEKGKRGVKNSEVHIPTVAREVYDVSGAGDTVIGVMALTLAAGGSMREAAVLANLAAGIVVGKLGTASVSVEELMQAMEERLGKS